MWKFGPVPKPIFPVLRGLVEDRQIKIEEVPYYRHVQKRYV